jgi:hypothetical protein
MIVTSGRALSIFIVATFLSVCSTFANLGRVTGSGQDMVTGDLSDIMIERDDRVIQAKAAMALSKATRSRPDAKRRP